MYVECRLQITKYCSNISISVVFKISGSAFEFSLLQLYKSLERLVLLEWSRAPDFTFAILVAPYAAEYGKASILIPFSLYVVFTPFNTLEIFFKISVAAF